MNQEHNMLNLAEGLATLFHPLAEVALLGPNNETVAVFNRLNSDQSTSLQPNKIATITINKSQTAKAMLIPLGQYALRIIVDTTCFQSLQTLLQGFLQQQTIPSINNDWQQQVTCTINDYLRDNHSTLQALTAQEKRNLILLLNSKELLRYQDATKYLANILAVSRATIYNYLKEGTQIKQLEIHQVDAFTDEPFSGNPAGVVLEADNLNDILMKKIAREMNLSETSFLLKSKKADIQLRYFTPNGAEVKFCGHSTVGALYMIAHKKLFNITKPGDYQLKLETKIGLISAGITLKKDEGIIVQFQTPPIDLVPSKISHQELASALGIPIKAVDISKPVMYEKNNQDVYITIRTLKELEKIQVDQKSAKLFADKNKIVAYALICPETVAKNSHLHMRCFAPSVGIPEDPFTGSVLGGLARYVVMAKLIKSNLKLIRIEQGHFISRPGFVDMQLIEGQCPLIIAKARHFFSTQINL